VDSGFKQHINLNSAIFRVQSLLIHLPQITVGEPGAIYGILHPVKAPAQVIARTQLLKKKPESCYAINLSKKLTASSQPAV